MLVIPGWENSKGVKAEIKWAKKNNLKMFFPKLFYDLNEIIKWAK